MKNIKITAGKEKKLNSNNYNQSKIKEYYNNHNGSKPDLGSGGICWCSTAVSILKFNDVSTDKNTLGYNLISYAYDKKKWITATSTGLDNGEIADLLTYEFGQYSISKKGNVDYYNLYKTLKSNVDSNKVVAFGIVNHTMTGCGYVTYTVNYDKKKLLGGGYSNKKELEDFAIVNDTWADSSEHQYSYFPVNELGTNIISRWDFGLVKILNK